MDEGVVSIILAVVGLLGSYLAAKYGSQYQKTKAKVNDVVEVLVKLTNAATKIKEAAKDDKVNEAEFQQIVGATEELIKAAQDLLTKQG